ncbi:hypothetical protein BpHYR1_002714 [Brachionus plicatilis]|uniref:Uncharacterized protein n=1 Tax=Brachionus plicatilis TaxID=10195 RepID=A0A3M7QHN5_BRAPC|nr:hypothetical protein BpHYR1_002714 [Brachionus plicatilis]
MKIQIYFLWFINSTVAVRKFKIRKLKSVLQDFFFSGALNDFKKFNCHIRVFNKKNINNLKLVRKSFQKKLN